MFASFDFRCIGPQCGHEEDRFVKKEVVDLVRCSKCDSSTIRLPAGTRTTFRHADRKLKR